MDQTPEFISFEFMMNKKYLFVVSVLLPLIVVVIVALWRSTRTPNEGNGPYFQPSVVEEKHQFPQKSANRTSRSSPALPAQDPTVLLEDPEEDRLFSESRMLYELAEQQQQNPSNDPIDDLIEQFDLIIDMALGSDFPTEKRTQIFASKRQMHEAIEIFDAALDREEITFETYWEETASLLDQHHLRVGEVLTDAEYEALYEIPKSESPSAILKGFAP